MAKPFANSQQYNGDLIDSYIMELQIGSNTDDGGLAQMRSIQLGKLKSYLKEGMGATFNYRGKYGTLPTDLAVGDSFVASMTFTVGGQTYEEGHLYAWNGTSWDDITDIFTQYAQQAEVDSINERLTEAEEKIDALSGFIFKGEATRATLPTPSASNQGWVYYLTDESIYVASDGTQWVTVMSFVGQTIAEGDTTHAPSSDAVYKALAERDAKDADLQSQIVNTNAELDNVEALIGGDVEVDNIDPAEGQSLLAQSRLIHHPNMLPNGEFGRVGARSVAWNQLINPNASISADVGGIIQNNFDGTWTITGTSQNNAYIVYNLSPTIGHTYFFAYKLSKSVTIGTSGFLCGFNSGAYAHFDSPNGIVFAENTTENFAIRIVGGYDASGLVVTPILVDLTIMGMTSYTAEQLSSMFCGSYPYDTGHIYDLNPEGFLIRGVNLWDEQYEIADISGATGGWMSGNFVCSKNKIRVFPNTTYCIASPNNQGVTNQQYVIYKYREDGSYIGYQWLTNQISTFTTDADCTHIYFRNNKASSTYNHDIQICDNTIPTSVKTVHHSYEEHTVDTPQISDGHYVNESLYDYVENVVEDGIVKGKKHKVVGTIVYDGSTDENWVKASGNGNGNNFYIQIDSLVKAGSEGYAGRLLCDKLTPVSTHSASAFTIGTNVITGYRDSSNNYPNQNWIYVRIDDTITSASLLKIWLASNPITVYYELAEEVITDCEPLRSFDISDYATVEPITPQDELVNRIDVLYSVKTVSANTLIERIEQNTADIAEEKAIRSAQVSALDKRVTNLELKTGDQLDVDYPSDIYGMNGVPSDVEPYAEVKALRGVGRSANQLVDTTKPSSYNATQNVSGTAFDITTIVSAGYGGFRGIDLIAGHVYLFAVDCKTKASSSIRVGWFNSQGQGVVPSFTYLSQGFNAQLFTPSVSGTDNQFLFYGEVGKTDYYDNFIICDLNVYFNTFDLSFLGATDSAKLATIQQKYPWLLEPSDYGTSAVFSTYTAVKSVGRNLAKTNPTFFDSPYIPTFDADKCYKVTAGVTYYWKIFEKTFTTYRARLFFYDMEGNPLTTPSTSWVTEVSSNGFYVNGQGLLWGGNASDTTKKWTFSQNFYILFVFTLGDTTSSSVISKFCFNVTDADDGTYTEYFTDTLTLPTPVTLKEAGSVSEEYYPKTGRITHPVDSATVTIESIYQRESNPNCDYALFRIPSAWLNVTSIFIEGVLRAVGLSWDTVATPSLFLVYDTANRWMAVSVSKGTTLEQAKATYDGRAICYALATPSPDTYVDPILDPHVKVESNGTVNPVQSQSPEVDSAMTVEYMAS